MAIIGAASCGTVLTTTIWPVTVVPVTIFLAAVGAFAGFGWPGDPDD